MYLNILLLYIISVYYYNKINEYKYIYYITFIKIIYIYIIKLY